MQGLGRKLQAGRVRKPPALAWPIVEDTLDGGSGAYFAHVDDTPSRLIEQGFVENVHRFACAAVV